MVGVAMPGFVLTSGVWVQATTTSTMTSPTSHGETFRSTAPLSQRVILGWDGTGRDGMGWDGWDGMGWGSAGMRCGWAG
eukprot:2434994-Rhodomonas_salina.4